MYGKMVGVGRITHDIKGEQLIGEASGLRPWGRSQAVNASAGVRMQRIDTREHRLRLKSAGTKKESVTEVIRHADVDPTISSVIFVGQEMIIVAQPVVQDHEAKWRGDHERIATLAQSPGKKRAWKMRKYTQGGFFEHDRMGRRANDGGMHDGGAPAGNRSHHTIF